MVGKEEGKEGTVVETDFQSTGMNKSKSEHVGTVTATVTSRTRLV